MNLKDLQAFFNEVEDESIQLDNKHIKNPNKTILTAHIERERRFNDRYYEIGENINKSEKLRAKISKDIKNNVPKEDLLLTALECIGLMTGDIVFYRQSINNLNKR